VPSRPGHGERLDQLVPLDHFDLAYAVNALDHSYDPLAVIAAMLRATKRGGWLALDHYVDEAEYEGYAGLHQWNFRAEGGEFVIWNKDHRIVVGDALPDAAEVVTGVAHGVADGEKDWLMVRIRKRDVRGPVNGAADQENSGSQTEPSS
jgi:SAM-dependent methyltransferase